MDFYDKLKDIRRSRGFTIREVAQKSGVSTAYISQLENGNRGVPSPDILAKLSNGLETSYPELMKLAGYVDDDSDPAEQRPLNLRLLLHERILTLDGRTLSDQEKRWIDRMLTAMFSLERPLQ